MCEERNIERCDLQSDEFYVFFVIERCNCGYKSILTRWDEINEILCLFLLSDMMFPKLVASLLGGDFFSTRANLDVSGEDKVPEELHSTRAACILMAKKE